MHNKKWATWLSIWATLRVKKFFLLLRWNFLYFNVCIASSYQTSLRIVFLPFHHSYLSSFHGHWWDPSESPHVQAKQSQLSQPLLTGEVQQILDQLLGPLLGSFQHIQVSLVLRCPELEAALHIYGHFFFSFDSLYTTSRPLLLLKKSFLLQFSRLCRRISYILPKYEAATKSSELSL